MVLHFVVIIECQPKKLTIVKITHNKNAEALSLMNVRVFLYLCLLYFLFCICIFKMFILFYFGNTEGLL